MIKKIYLLVLLFRIVVLALRWRGQELVVPQLNRTVLSVILPLLRAAAVSHVCILGARVNFLVISALSCSIANDGALDGLFFFVRKLGKHFSWSCCLRLSLIWEVVFNLVFQCGIR